MGEHQSPAIPSLRHCLQEGRGFYILSHSLNVFIHFPLSPKATLAQANCSLVSSLRDGFHKLERRQICQTPHDVCTSALTIPWPQETGTERLTCGLHFAQALAANMRQIIYLISFKVLLRKWKFWLDHANFVTWRNLSCQKHVIKWKVFSSEIFNLLSRSKALLLLHFRTDLPAVSTLPNKVSPQKRKPACASL